MKVQSHYMEKNTISILPNAASWPGNHLHPGVGGSSDFFLMEYQTFINDLQLHQIKYPQKNTIRITILLKLLRCS